MTNIDTLPAADPKKRSKWPMILGLFLFLTLGGGGFYAVYSGVILVPLSVLSLRAAKSGLEGLAFVPIDTLTISLAKTQDNSHLQFSAQLEVNADRAQEVAALSPRILDVIIGYLRAVDIADLQDPDALVRLRAQLLRRIQIVTGQGCVRDLLVTEFVLD